jgi:hypothetical protein
MPDTTNSMIPIERIQQFIYIVRKHKVVFDSDLAQLYGVETGALVRAVKRNIERFPTDFMFHLTKSEYEVFLRCQTGISKEGRGGRRYIPYAFTNKVLLCFPVFFGVNGQLKLISQSCEPLSSCGKYWQETMHLGEKSRQWNVNMMSNLSSFSKYYRKW